MFFGGFVCILIIPILSLYENLKRGDEKRLSPQQVAHCLLTKYKMQETIPVSAVKASGKGEKQ